MGSDLNLCVLALAGADAMAMAAAAAAAVAAMEEEKRTGLTADEQAAAWTVQATPQRPAAS